MKRRKLGRNPDDKVEEPDDKPKKPIEFRLMGRVATRLNDDLAGSIAGASDLLDRAIDHLTAVDGRFTQLVQRFTCRPFTPAGLREPRAPFQSLAMSVLSQQISGAAARSILRRFLALFDNAQADLAIENEAEVADSAPTVSAAAAGAHAHSKEQPSAAPVVDRARLMEQFPEPEEVLKKSVEELRGAGLSYRKAEYVRGIAQAFVDKHLSEDFFVQATDAEIFDTLTKIRGLGPWTVEMFLVFSLKRPDVISLTDIGVQRGMALFFTGTAKPISIKPSARFKYMSEADMIRHSEPWKPFRSIGMWYMWRVTAADYSVDKPRSKSAAVKA